MVRYFKVMVKSGAYIEGVFYPYSLHATDILESIVPLEMKENQKPPLWGVEVDEHGKDLVVNAPAVKAPSEKIGDNLGSLIAKKALGENPALSQGEAKTRKETIKVALSLLDPTDATHWTKDGVPHCVVIAKTTGLTAVTREEIERIAPDFKRQVPVE